MDEPNWTPLKKLMEASLFMAPSVVTVADLSRITSRSVIEVRVALNELIHEFNARESALEIRDESDGYRMAVRPEFEPLVSHLAASPEFHKGVLKTLALIAFRQPVKQSEIIDLRNQKAYDHIRVLLEKGFIKKEKQGITFILTTTRKFVEYFGDALHKKELEGVQVGNAKGLQQKLTDAMNESEGKD
ncbi:MAG: SMC-Scp complex subunit ScpB [Candidatus Diapherotrites archaeon]|nr:SMC-Scp complex subunit ScpB [Candidatus Diapherotrites archaeon]